MARSTSAAFDTGRVQTIMEMVTCTEHVHPNSIVDPHARETTRDAYAEIAGRYDRFHGRFDQHDPAEVRFFSELFERNDVHWVLDCACGTGRHLHLVHTLGLE